MKFRQSLRLFRLCVLMFALALADTGFAQDGSEFYADRGITVLVGSGVGGTTDTSARLIARHLRSHLPGNPSIIVQNMPGGGSVTMANHVYRSAPRDGTVLGYALPGIVTAQMMEPNRTRYDLASTERDRTLVEFIEIGSNLGWPLFAPPDVPATRIEILRAGFSRLMSDPAFEEAVEDTLKDRLNPSNGDELTEFVDRALNTPQETVSEVKAILGL